MVPAPKVMHDTKWQLFLSAIVQKLTVDLRKLQESKAWHLAKQKMQEVKNLVNDALSKITSAKDETLG